MSDPATEAALREMSRTIGGLESTVSNLVTTWQHNDSAATQGRRDLHQKVDELRTEVQDLRAQITGAQKDIAELKPSVKAFDNAKQQVVGAQQFGRLIRACLLFVSGGIPWIVAHWMTVSPKLPPH